MARGAATAPRAACRDVLINVNIGQIEMVKDPWKIDNPPKSY